MKLKIFAIAALLIPLYSPTPILAINSLLFQEDGEVSLNTADPAKVIILTQENINGSTLTLGQAADLISRWLKAKQKIFASPFDREILASLTTGILYSDTLKAIASLRNSNAYYRYGIQKVETVERFIAVGDKAIIEVKVTEEVTFYQKGKVDNSSFNTKLVRYSLEYWDGVWKIADANVID